MYLGRAPLRFEIVLIGEVSESSVLRNAFRRSLGFRKVGRGDNREGTGLDPYWSSTIGPFGSPRAALFSRDRGWATTLLQLQEQSSYTRTASHKSRCGNLSENIYAWYMD
jgi:hypothetical protein